MAVITPAVSGAFSGRMGGVVFSKGRWGQVVRIRSVPVQPRNQRQSASRTMLAQLSSTWRSLGEEERQSWVDQARIRLWRGFSRKESHLSGHALFVAVNRFMVGSGLDLIRKTGVALALTPIYFTPQNYDAGLTIGTSRDSESNEHMLVWSTPSLSSGVTRGRSWRKIGSYSSWLAPGGVTVTDDYRAAFGNYPGETSPVGVRVLVFKCVPPLPGLPVEFGMVGPVEMVVQVGP